MTLAASSRICGNLIASSLKKYQASREKERMCNLFTAICFLFVKTESLLSARTSVVNLIWFGTIIKTSCPLSW